MIFKHLFLTAVFAFTIVACDKGDVDHQDVDGFPEYTIIIMSPNAENVAAGESFHIHVNFDEASDLTIHHVNIQITTSDGEVIYNMPTSAHVHADSGPYEYHDDFTPDVPAGTELTLSAKVWGHDAGISEESNSTLFTIN